MNPTPDLTALAAEMKAALDGARSIEPITARHPEFDLTAAYAVARLVHRARVEEGARPLGRKIGFTNPDMWVVFGVHQPIWGHVYDTTVEFLPDTGATCSLAGLVEPRIEPEIVFRFRTAPRPGDGPAELLDAIEWVAQGFEIVQSHCPGWKFQAADTVADGSLHGRLLVGPPRPVKGLGANVLATLQTFELDLACNDRPVETGRGSNVLGSPLAAVAHLLDVLAGQPESPPLQAGEIVTTGTLTRAYPVQPAETWQSSIRGIPLPGLRLEFTT